MACFSGPEIPNDGLVFCYDQGNTDKSWKGAPTTNLAKNASNVVDWSVSNLLQSVTRSTIVADEVYRITSTSGTGTSFRIYFIGAVLVNGSTYTVSYRYKIISGGPLFRANDWCDESITRTTTALANNAFYETAVGTRGTYDSTYRFLDFEMSNNTVVEIYDLQLEQRSFATPYTSTQVRSNTQAVLDLTGRNAITANSLTYASNGSFSFNGSSDQLTMPTFDTAALSTQQITLEAWVKHTNLTGSQAYINNWFNFSTGDQRGVILRTFSDQVFPSFWWCWGADYNAVYASSFTMSPGAWYHVVGTYAKNVAARIYVNGVLNNSTTNTTVNNDIVYDTTNRFKIGQSNINGSWMNGQIDQTKVYNRALTATEVAQNFEATRGRYGI